MQFRNGAQVVTADGDVVGSMERVVIDPRSNEVTHIVVRQGMLLHEDKLFPVDGVAEANENEVRLDPSVSDLEAFPPYLDLDYVPLDESEQERTGYPASGVPPVYWYPTTGMGPLWGTGYYGPYPVPGNVRLDLETNIPEGTLALEEGARVVSADGENVGRIEQVSMDPDSNQAVYFVLASGLLVTERKRIPMHWVDHLEEDWVHLVVSKKFIDRLPKLD
jgi:sporulation protein YlmC with PRC-barrel domain